MMSESLKSAYTLFFTFLDTLFTFSSQVLFWGLGFSVLTRSMLCLIDKFSQFCHTGNKYEVAIACAFGRILRMSTISADLPVRQICMCVQLCTSIGT